MRQIQNPPNPFESVEREWLDEPPDVHLEGVRGAGAFDSERERQPRLAVSLEREPVSRLLSRLRVLLRSPTHEYLGFGAGTDFESRIVVKSNAPELLRRAFDKRAWSGELIMFSGNTDCYQPLEATWRMTRACLEVCAEYRNPVGVITRSLLVQRDLDVLQRLHADADVHVFFSIPFADDALARAIEPQAPLVSRRFEAMRQVAAAGIPTGVSVAPIIPGLNDDDIAPVLERAWDAGARYASHILLRLPGSVRSVFFERLRAALPDRAQRVENRIRETRGGALSDARFGERMRGHGVYWDMIEQQWDIHTRRIGFTRARSGERATRANTFRRPTAASPQGVLFADGGDS